MPSLSRVERGWASGVLYAMFPLRDGEAEFARDFALDQTIPRFFVGIPLKAALGLRAALLLIVVAPMFLIGRFAIFSTLPRTDRMRVLERLLKNRSYAVRQLVMAWKAVGGLVVVGHPSLRTARERSHSESLRKERADTRAHEDALGHVPTQAHGHAH
ncbi:MAG: hypothetical protein U0174_23745 [Polyangiaceae bacterium]